MNITPEELREFFKGPHTQIRFQQFFEGRVIGIELWYDLFQHIYGEEKKDVL